MDDRGVPWTEELLRRGDWTRRLARSLLGQDDADDAVQESWVAALRHPPDLARPLGPWLRTVVRNHAATRARHDQRRQRREALAEPPAPPDSPEASLERLQTHQILVEAVTRLPDPYRQAVLLRYFEGLSSAQIGERVGLPAGTVRGRLKTALEELRQSLDRRYERRRPWRKALCKLLLTRPGRVAR